ncbi:MAG: hypothetical protein ACLFUJ_02515 [Phycisphaerae bacterium]
MPVSNAKNYFYVVIGGLVALAAIILIGLQWGQHTDTFNLYGKVTTVNLSILVMLSAIGGVVVWYTSILLVRGTLGIWKYRRQQKKLDRMADKKVADRDKAQKSAAKEPSAGQ